MGYSTSSPTDKSKAQGINISATLQPDKRLLIYSKTDYTNKTSSPRSNNAVSTNTTSSPSTGQPCPDNYHNKDKFHPLIDPVSGCHFDHEHHDNPHDVDFLFGPTGSFFEGDEVSYPWQTFSHHGLENDVKHQGYKWLVRKNMPCYSAFSDGCLPDFRVQIHAIMSSMDATVRFHSFSMEAKGCRENEPTRCGTIKTGGWADYGVLQSGDDDIIPIPGNQNPPVINVSGHRRIHYPVGGPGNSNFATWYGGNSITLVALMTSDAWGPVDPKEPSKLNFFCPDFRCGNNASTLEAHAIGFTIEKSLDTDKNGIVNFKGFTDRNGQIAQSCTSISLDCIPLEINNMPVGSYQYRDDGFQLQMKDYDNSPKGSGWLKHPN